MRPHPGTIVILGATSVSSVVLGAVNGNNDDNDAGFLQSGWRRT